MFKRFFIFLYYSIFFLFLFIASDFFISKYTNLFKVKKDCFNYIKLKSGKNSYYTYNLAKNCFAYEHKGATPSYKVYTDFNGLRVPKNKQKTKSTSKIIFLGDSFTYGFGVDFENSVPGLLSKKINYSDEVINFGVPGYSPSMNLVNLRNYLAKNSKIKILKVFYILDITDVHDEANRWKDVNGINLPVIEDEIIKKEIKKTFDFKKKFRTTRYVSYIVNNNLRNLRKQIKILFENDENNIEFEGTFWGSFIHTSQNKLLKNTVYKNHWKRDYKFGLKKITKKITDISNLLESYDTEFYIVIHPWIETIEFGQKEFDWEKFANELCVSSKCKKVINFFDTVEEYKKEEVNWKTDLYFKKDLHFNKTGNALYANKIYYEAFEND
tara:strand:- start:1707 stop:2855 length:1149 start_codon:yes stop_codon:yes gene_type:complete